MTVCVSCQLYLLRDELENLISRETEGQAKCQNFQTHREVNTTVFHYAQFCFPKYNLKQGGQDGPGSLT